MPRPFPRLRQVLPFVLIAWAALWLRTADLDRRPMHADEANQALKTVDLLEGRGYRFDPAEHHGPTLYYAGAAAAWLSGQRSGPELTEVALRRVPALLGVVSVLLAGVLARPLGRRPALFACAFAAAAPLAVYFDRAFIQEGLLAAGFLAFLACTGRWGSADGRARAGWASAAGAAAGFMLATKASAPVLLVAASIGAAVGGGRALFARVRATDALCAAAAAAAVAAAFYSSFGSHPAGLGDALRTFALHGERLQGITGHEKPWTYYAGLFWGGVVGGHRFGTPLLVILGAAGAVAALMARKTPSGRRVAGWAAGLLVGLLLYSLVPYKTPWQALHAVVPLCVLASVALDRLLGGEGGPRWRAGAAAVALTATLGQGVSQCLKTSLRMPADPRNPFAYVHTSPDMLKVPALARALPPGAVIKVISPEVWPLPWYLRGHARTGYWTSPPAEADADLLFVAADWADEVGSGLAGTYEQGVLGLRPGVLLVTFRRTGP